MQILLVGLWAVAVAGFQHGPLRSHTLRAPVATCLRMDGDHSPAVGSASQSHITKHAPGKCAVAVPIAPVCMTKRSRLSTLVSRAKATRAPLLRRLRAYLTSALLAFAILTGGGHSHFMAQATVAPPVTGSYRTVDLKSEPSNKKLYAEFLETPATRRQVIDDAQLLDKASRARLTEQLREAEARSDSEIMLVTLKTIDGRDEKTYTQNLFNNWHVGESRDHRGVLITYVADGGTRGRGHIQVAVWKGFNSVVSHSWTTEMLEDSVLPKLRESPQQFEAAFSRCVERIEPRLTMPAWKQPVETAAFILVGGAFMWWNLRQADRKARTCDECGAICDKGNCETWKVVKPATDVSAGQSERKIRCQECGAVSLKTRTIEKYDGKHRNSDGTWRYYRNSDSDGGGSDGGGGGGGSV